jgi:hypothetical protein
MVGTCCDGSSLVSTWSDDRGPLERSGSGPDRFWRGWLATSRASLRDRPRRRRRKASSCLNRALLVGAVDELPARGNGASSACSDKQCSRHGACSSEPPVTRLDGLVPPLLAVSGPLRPASRPFQGWRRWGEPQVACVAYQMRGVPQPSLFRHPPATTAAVR